METLSIYINFEIIKFINSRWFINYLCINKKTLRYTKEYLKYKKNLYIYNGTSKTYKNCLYKLQYKDKYGFEYDNIVDKNLIIKIVSITPINKSGKYKIIYWVLSHLKKIGNLSVSYPDWTIIKDIDKDKFIPFY